MCGFSFTVFLSAFQLLPTAPYHIIDLGGSTFASGMFLGFLTYSSAFSAPLTGALADRIGQRRVLMISSLALVGFSLAYAVITDVRGTARPGADSWRLLVGVAVGVGSLHDQPAAREPAGRRYRVLGAVNTVGCGGRAAGRLLDLSPGVDLALRGDGCAQPRNGGDCFEADGTPAFASGFGVAGSGFGARGSALRASAVVFSNIEC